MQVPSSSPAVFSFNSLDVRVVDRNGEPWFVAKDVADILGYAKPENAVKAHCKRPTTFPLESGGQVRHMTIIPESDVFRLIVKSQLPAAEKFEAWVMEDVLPAIRKTGSYSVSGMQHFSVPVEANRVFESFHSLAIRIGFEGNQAVLSANMATRTLTGVDPLLLMGATHLQAGNQNRHFTPTELGQRYHMNGREMNIALEAAGLQTKHGKQWMPTVKGRAYAVLLDTTKRKGEGTPIQQLKWTADVLDAMPALEGGAA